MSLLNRYFAGITGVYSVVASAVYWTTDTTIPPLVIGPERMDVFWKEFDEEQCDKYKEKSESDVYDYHHGFCQSRVRCWVWNGSVCENEVLWVDGDKRDSTLWPEFIEKTLDKFRDKPEDLLSVPEEESTSS